MLQNLKKMFAKTALLAIALQMVVMSMPQATHATVAPDLVAPVVNSITYGGKSAVLNSGNTYVVDVSTSDDSTLQSIDTDVSEASDLNVGFMGTTILSGYSLNSGNNNIDIATLMGSPVQLSYLQTLAGILGTVTLDMSVSDASLNTTNYELVIVAKDVVAPIVSNLSFAGKAATYEPATHIFAIDMNGVSDTDLATAKIKFDTTETSMIAVTSPFTYSAAMVGGSQELDLTAIHGGAITNADLTSIAVGDKVNILFSATDPFGNASNYGIVLTLDQAAAVITSTVKPEIVNNLGAVINVFFSSNEMMKLGDVSSVTYKVDGVDFTPANPALITVDNTDYALFHALTIPADFFKTAGVKNEIELAYTAADKAGNVTSGSVKIPVDMIAPVAVTNLVATVDASGYVVLSWVNPAEGTYVGLKVMRDGAFLTTLPAGTTTFTDKNVVAGQTYKYTVTAYDKAGNETITPAVSIAVPSAHVAAAVSDSTTVANVDAAVSSDTNKADTKGDEKKDEDKGMPLWAIILLIVLAGVGGYLIYNQKPATTNAAPSAAPVVKKPAPKKKPVVKKKTTPKKKK